MAPYTTLTDATATWNHSHRGGSWMLHGHEHGRVPSIPNRLDVGVDVHGFRPLALEDLERLIQGTRK